MIPVVVGQIPVSWSVKRNVEVVTETIHATESGSLLVLPEAALSGYDDELSGFEELDPEEIGWACRQVAAAATGANVHVACGTLLPADGHWWNAGIYFRPGGEPCTYRKINLAMHERGRLRAGSILPTVRMQLPAGEFRAGIQLCREIRFPEQWHCLARQGAQVLIYLTYAANPNEPADVWRAHLISRAAETQRFLVAANVADPRQHCPSMIISPRGEVLCEALIGERALLRQSLDLSTVRDGYLSQQREDVVRITCNGSAPE